MLAMCPVMISTSYFDVIFEVLKIQSARDHSGIILTCAVFLMIIALTVTGCFFAHKITPIEKGLPVMSHQPTDHDPVSKDVKSIEDRCSH